MRPMYFYQEEQKHCNGIKIKDVHAANRIPMLPGVKEMTNLIVDTLLPYDPDAEWQQAKS